MTKEAIDQVFKEMVFSLSSLGLIASSLGEKKEALRFFCQNNLEKLSRISKEPDSKDNLLLGYVFEALVRSEPRFRPTTSFEIAVESFLLSCLEDPRNCSFLEKRKWHVPDILKIRKTKNSVLISGLYEVKTSLGWLRSGQMFDHLRDLLILIERINNSNNQEKIPEFLRSRKLVLDQSFQKKVVLPFNYWIRLEKLERLKSDSWQIGHSVFSIEEAIFVAKKLFPEACAGLNYRRGVTANAQDIQQSLGKLLIFLSDFLVSLLGRKFSREQMMSSAFIWLCSDLIILDPQKADELVNVHNLNPEKFINTEGLSERFSLLQKKMKDYYFISLPDQLVRFLQYYYNFHLKMKLSYLAPNLYEKQPINRLFT